MIHKIIEIRNCGKFLKYNPSETAYKWNGIFSSINTIYAENGSGKTTFTQILKSLSGNSCELVEKRKSLMACDPIKISVIDDHRKQYVFSINDWSEYMPYIEVYDNYYSESNVYVVSLGNYDTPSNFYDIVPDGYTICNKICISRRKRRNCSVAIRNIRHDLSEIKETRAQKKLLNRLNSQIARKEKLSASIKDLENTLNRKITEVENLYVEKANNYLNRFNPNLRIKKANKQGHQLVYHISINNVDLRSDSTNISLKHSLSEGDKSSLSLSFFLARLELLPNLEKRIIVFDDPISSFDTRRRIMTISLLSRVAEKSAQFFLLSHDLNFVKEFSDRHSNPTNLKIVWLNGSSVFVKHDLKLETMTGISKDMYTLQNYLHAGAMSDFEKREVIRCIRPVIEGIFRLKYFNLLTDHEWLGDFLCHIRESEITSPFFRLNQYYEELSDINDYCKQYHHSNPKYMEEPIFDEELKQFVQRTLNIIAYI